MFKFRSTREQLLDAAAEIAKLKATVGELPPIENIEGVEPPEQLKLVDRAEQSRADIDYLAIMGGVDL